MSSRLAPPVLMPDAAPSRPPHPAPSLGQGAAASGGGAGASPSAGVAGGTTSARQALFRGAAARHAARGAARERRRALQQQGLWLQADELPRVQARLLRLAMSGVARSPLGAPDASRAPVEPIGADAPWLVRRRTPRSVGELRRRLQGALESPTRSLALAMERVVGRSDRLPVVFFERGAIAARAVGRVVAHDPVTDAPTPVGTGVLVAPGLLLTTHLVLPDATAARHATIEFRHEYRLDGTLDTPVGYAFDPRVCFLTDPALDVTLVAVADPRGTLGTFGFHPLVAEDAAALVGETLSVIEHPGAEPKQVALRGCQLLDVLDDFVHYSLGTTCMGSPGAPVFNDQWELVALQHTAIPAVDAAGRPLTTDGTSWDPALPEDRLHVVAGEALRVSRLVAALRDRLNDRTLDEATRAALGWLLVRAGSPAPVVPLERTPAQGVAGVTAVAPTPAHALEAAIDELAGGSDAPIDAADAVPADANEAADATPAGSDEPWTLAAEAAAPPAPPAESTTPPEAVVGGAAPFPPGVFPPPPCPTVRRSGDPGDASATAGAPAPATASTSIAADGRIVLSLPPDLPVEVTLRITPIAPAARRDD